VQERIITLATPVFFALIALEIVVGWLRSRNTYRLDDAVSSLSLGVLSQVAAVFTRLLSIGIYVWLFQSFAQWSWPPDSAWSWIGALLFYDFCYYWHHRAMHRVNVLWAAHVVHHSSEEYNLSTALRQTGTGALFGWVFYVPMALAGVPPALFVAVGLIDLLYQFWIHTRQIGRLGWFDRVFASPSNHRVHHAVNDRYIDRNYGGVLILWDRLFGTFEDERDDEPIVYGTRAPLRSWNPLWANLEVYAALARDAWRAQRWRDRLQVWVRPPGWRPADVAAAWPRAPFAIERFEPYHPWADRGVRIHAGLQFALVLAAAVHFLQAHRDATLAQNLAHAAWILTSLVAIGGLFEGRRGFVWLDATRLAVAALVAGWLGSWFGPQTLAAGPRVLLVGLALASLAAVVWLGARARWRAPDTRASGAAPA